MTMNELIKKNLILKQLLKEYEGANQNLLRLERQILIVKNEIDTISESIATA
jgi:hypothetical protein